MPDPLNTRTAEADYDSAAEAWLSLEMVKLGMEYRYRAEEIALEFYARLTAERAASAVSVTADQEAGR